MRGVRAACWSAYFVVVTLMFGLVSLYVRSFARAQALALAKAWVGAALAGLRPICGITVRVSGLDLLPKQGPVLLASQHQSEFDTLVWMLLLERPSYVMKQELTRLPFVGPMLIPAGMIPVDRAAGARALRRLLQDCQAARAAGRQIVIFPEGTRVAPGERAALQPGIAAIALRLALPVYPVATDSGHCWRRGRFAKFPGPIHLAIGAPIAAGTPRESLLAGIEAHWRRCEADGFPAVDNSVDERGDQPGAAPPDAG